MSAVIDRHTGQRDHGLERDAALEREIDAVRQRMVNPSGTEAESKDAFTELAVLIRRRSTTQLLKLELERWMRRSEA